MGLWSPAAAGELTPTSRTLVSTACPVSASKLPRLRWQRLLSWAWGKVSEWEDLQAGKLAPVEQGWQRKKAAAMPTSFQVLGHLSQY